MTASDFLKQLQNISEQLLLCIDSFIKFRYFINRLWTIKLLTIQSKFDNLEFF